MLLGSLVLVSGGLPVLRVPVRSSLAASAVF